MSKMEGNASELFREELQTFTAATEKFLLNPFPITDKSEDEIVHKEKCCDLSTEEEMLSTQLEELKKENFSLRASINAWQLTLENKLEEFKEADLKLNEIYNKIWSEREKFCLKAEKFNDEHGILSEKWERQMKYLSDLETLKGKRIQDKNCQQEMEKLEKDVGELQKESKENENPATEAKENPKEERHRDEEPRREFSPKESYANLANSLEVGDRIEISEAKNEFFSIVDLEKLRMAKRMKQHRYKNNFPSK